MAQLVLKGIGWRGPVRAISRASSHRQTAARKICQGKDRSHQPHAQPFGCFWAFLGEECDYRQEVRLGGAKGDLKVLLIAPPRFRGRGSRSGDLLALCRYRWGGVWAATLTAGSRRSGLAGRSGLASTSREAEPPVQGRTSPSGFWRPSQIRTISTSRGSSVVRE